MDVGRNHVKGHASMDIKLGLEAVRRTVKAASEMGIKCLTLYSFSTENWARPKAEIAGLFKLITKICCR